jgi:hypothetical protein
MITAQIINTSYGWFAILCPLMLIGFNGKNKIWWTIWILINIAYSFTSGYTQLLAVAAPLVLMYHEPKEDRKPTIAEKKFFYYFYPIHLAGLAALQAIL